MMKKIKHPLMIFLFSALLILASTKESKAIYNLSTHYGKVLYSWIGGAPIVTGSYQVGGVFTEGIKDGMFSSPKGTAIDVAGNLMYVVNSANNRIQKFTLSTGSFIGAIGNSTTSGTCVAGKQTAWCTGGVFSSGSNDGMFSGPEGIVIDVAGNLMYVTDSSRIQKFTLSTGAFVGAIGNSTASGTCVAGKQTSWCTGGVFSSGTGDGMFSGPYAIAIDVTGNKMYVADSLNQSIQKFTLSTGAFIGAIGNSNDDNDTCQLYKSHSRWSYR